MSASTPHESMLPSQARAGTIAPGAQGSAEGTMAAKRLAAPPWHRIALAGVLLLAALLNFWWLNREGFSNLYYAATVRSMLSSWHNFLYASYDPGGFVSVDKPPLGLWIQAASAMLFGFHGLSLLLPQALAGVLCVGVLYHVVRRPFGVIAGLLAALMLALTPVNVATNRNNTMDSLLVLALLLAAWAVSRAAESGRLRLLILGMVLVGVGFNVKMLQAYLALPAFYLVYLVAAPLRRRTRLAHLALATVGLLGVSLSWALAVDLTPPDRRPYVGGSTNNSVLDLIVGYNGLARLLPGGLLPRGMAAAPQPAFAPGPRALPQGPAGIAPAPQAGAGGPPGMAGPAPAGGFIVSIDGENGARGPLRLLNEQLAGQAGWLLPLALLGLLVGWWQAPWLRPVDRRHQALLLWGGWLLTQAAFFSVATFWHRYYLVVLSPAIAALAGVAVVGLWREYRRPGWRGWLLPVALVGMAALHAAILADYPEWRGRLVPPILGLAGLAAGGLALLRASTQQEIERKMYGGEPPKPPEAQEKRDAEAVWLGAGEGILPEPPDGDGERDTREGGAAADDGARLDPPEAEGYVEAENVRWVVGEEMLLAPSDRGRDSPVLSRTATVLAGVGVVALLIGPAAWSGITVWNAPGDMLPYGGPENVEAMMPPPPPGANGPAGPRVMRLGLGLERVDPALVAYLQANRGEARWLAATFSAAEASPIIVASGEPVMALHGFGADQILTTEELVALVEARAVRFFLLPGDVLAPPPGAAPGGTAELPGNDYEGWVRENCRLVPVEEWGGGAEERGSEGAEEPGAFGRPALYDCAAG